MSENNKAVVRRLLDEVWNKGRREAIAEMLAPDGTITEGDHVSRGPEGFYPFFDRIQASFSDMRVTVDDSIVQGDKECVRWTCTMNHTGDGLGIPASGKRVTITGISIVRVHDGQLVEGWQNWDMQRLLEQISGAEPAPGRAAGDGVSSAAGRPV